GQRMTGDVLLGYGQDVVGQRRCLRDARPITLQPTGVGGGRTRLERRRGADDDHVWVVGVEDASPALLGGRLCIGEVSAPESEADRRAKYECRPLPCGHCFELEQRATDELSRLVVCA